MKQKDYIKKYLETTKNKLPFKVDLKNGVILDLQYDPEINNYRGYWKEENIFIGIWDIKFMLNCIMEDYKEFEIIL